MSDAMADNSGPATDADRLIERFGGIRPMATKLGIPVTTVQGWKKRGHIPENRLAEITAAAARLGLAAVPAPATPTPGPTPGPSPAATAVDGDPALHPALEAPLPPPRPPAPPVPALAPAPASSPEAAIPPTPPRADPATGTATGTADDTVTDMADDTAPPALRPVDRRRDARAGPRLSLYGAAATGDGPATAPPDMKAAPAPMSPQHTAPTTVSKPKRSSGAVSWLALLLALVGSAGNAAWTAYTAGDLDPVAERLGLPARALPGAAHALAVDTGLAKLAQRQAEQARALDDLGDKLSALERLLAAQATGSAVAPKAESTGNPAPSPAPLSADAAQRLDELAQQMARQAERQRALEQGLTALQSEASQAGQQVGQQLRTQMLADAHASGTARALVLSIGQLRAALEDGRPYAAELGDTRALLSPATGPTTGPTTADGGDDGVIPALLDGLAPQADKGVPTLAALRAGFDAAAHAAVRAENQDPSHPWTKRLLDGLRGLVTIRHKDGQAPGRGADAVTDRAAAHLAAGDLAATLGELATLAPPAAQAPALVDWVAAAKTRLTAQETLVLLDRQAIAKLAPPSPIPPSPIPSAGSGQER